MKRKGPRMHNGFLLKKDGDSIFPWRIYKMYQYLGLAYIEAAFTLEDAKKMISRKPEHFRKKIKDLDDLEERYKKEKQGVIMNFKIVKELPILKTVYESENLTEVQGHGKMPKTCLAYERAYYANGRIYNAFFTICPENKTPELVSEFDDFINHMNAKLPTLRDEETYCSLDCEKKSDTEFNAYAQGKYGYYFIRFSLSAGDYHRRIYCFSKAASDALRA